MVATKRRLAVLALCLLVPASSLRAQDKYAVAPSSQTAVSTPARPRPPAEPKPRPWVWWVAGAVIVGVVAAVAATSSRGGGGMNRSGY